jgi:hypothetical protein
MLTMPSDEPVTVTEHAPDESVHICEENVTLPLSPDCKVNVTVPVGEEPETLAVHVEVELTAIEEGEQARETAVGTSSDPVTNSLALDSNVAPYQEDSRVFP